MQVKRENLLFVVGRLISAFDTVKDDQPVKVLNAVADLRIAVGSNEWDNIVKMAIRLFSVAQGRNMMVLSDFNYYMGAMMFCLVDLGVMSRPPVPNLDAVLEANRKQIERDRLPG